MTSGLLSSVTLRFILGESRVTECSETSAVPDVRALRSDGASAVKTDRVTPVPERAADAVCPGKVNS